MMRMQSVKINAYRILLNFNVYLVSAGGKDEKVKYL